jgi:hypothetical protein
LIHLPLTGVLLEESLIAPAPILDALISMVGNSRRIMLSAYGVVMTEPGAPAQPAHPDYRGAEEIAFTIGIPLTGGGTTRFLARGEAEFVPLPYEPGDGLAWDFCTFHGGEPHSGPERRFLLYAAFTSPWIIDPNVTLTGMPRLNVRPAEVLRSSDRVFALFHRYLGELSRVPLWLDALADLSIDSAAPALRGGAASDASSAPGFRGGALSAPTPELQRFFDAVPTGGLTDLARTLEIASRCGLSSTDAIEVLRGLSRADRLRDAELAEVAAGAR